MTSTLPIINKMSSTGQLIRFESYERDRKNLIVSKFNNFYAVINLGKKTKTKKKEIAIRSYKVTKDESGEIHCTCPSNTDKNEICKHLIAVSEKARIQRETAAAARQMKEERTSRVLEAVSRW